MREICEEQITSALDEALSVMAFMCVDPADDQSPAPDAPLITTTITYEGPVSGKLQITCGEAFGAVLATNLLGEEPAPGAVSAAAEDALRELANILCGTLLRSSGSTVDASVELGVPSQQLVTAGEDWTHLVGPNPLLASVEGHTIAIHFE